MHQSQVAGAGRTGAENWNLDAGGILPLSVLATLAKKKDKFGKNTELLRSLEQILNLKDNKTAQARDSDTARGAMRADAEKVGKQAVEAAKNNLGDKVKGDAMSMSGMDIANQVLGTIQSVASVIGLISG